MQLNSSNERNLLKIVQSHPKESFLANKLFSAFFPKAVNRYNKALSLMCITSSACALKLSQLSPLRQKCCWNGAPHPPGLGLTAQRGLVLTPAHQPMPKTRHRGQRTSCGVLLHYPFSKLLPDKEALVRGKPKQHFWPRELYVTVPSEQTISNSC